MISLNEVKVNKEIIVKRISASKFEVYDGSQIPPSTEEKPEKIEKSPLKRKSSDVEEVKLMPRQSVIQRAPPAPKISIKAAEETVTKKRKIENVSTGVILIKDAIMYRIVDILMWKVVGENMLKTFGYPSAPTYQVLWKIIQYLGAKKMEPLAKNSRMLSVVWEETQIKKTNIIEDDFLYDKAVNFFGGPKTEVEGVNDHDCGGNITCFVDHVYQFLDICAPDLWKKTGWARLPIEETLRRIYYEDLIPYLRSMDICSNVSILQCHSDIVLLEKWEKQKFTAVTWTGEKYFSQLPLNCPKCPQCSNRHF